MSFVFIPSYGERYGVGVDTIKTIDRGHSILSFFEKITFQFETDLQTPVLELDFKQICDNYQSALYVFYYEMSQYLVKLEGLMGALYAQGQASESAGQVANASDIEQCVEMKDKIKITICVVGETHDLLKDDRESVYMRRNDTLQALGIYCEKQKEYCECYKYTQPQYVYDSINLANCPLCCRDNVHGIKPPCCDEKQEICLDCLKTHMQTVYKSTVMTGTQKLQVERLLATHYTCPFCRAKCCLKKYFPLLLE